MQEFQEFAGISRNLSGTPDEEAEEAKRMIVRKRQPDFIFILYLFYLYFIFYVFIYFILLIYFFYIYLYLYLYLFIFIYLFIYNPITSISYDYTS